MALCRCSEEQHSPPRAQSGKYVIPVKPVGYPNTSSICGRNGCNNPGLIWLTKKELAHYNRDKQNRVFSYANAVSKVKVK